LCCSESGDEQKEAGEMASAQRHRCLYFRRFFLLNFRGFCYGFRRSAGEPAVFAGGSR
jgi:hypothetical protein